MIIEKPGLSSKNFKSHKPSMSGMNWWLKKFFLDDWTLKANPMLFSEIRFYLYCHFCVVLCGFFVIYKLQEIHTWINTDYVSPTHSLTSHSLSLSFCITFNFFFTLYVTLLFQYVFIKSLYIYLYVYFVLGGMCDMFKHNQISAWNSSVNNCNFARNMAAF